MEKISSKEVQNIQLEILKKVASYCDKNQLKYYLCYGTLLGAVTKKGFRNEYSDIDIVMFRKDYDKFCQSFNEKDLKVLDCKNKDYYYDFAKVVNTNTILHELKIDVKDLGVYIDIMPIDYIPDNYFLKKLYLFHNYLLQRLSLLKRTAYLDNYNLAVKIIYKIGSLLVFLIPKNFFSKLMNNFRKKCSSKNKNIIFSFYDIDKNVFKNREKYEFEGYLFYGPKEYDICLTRIYGDYKKTTIKKHHNRMVAYWK